MAADTFSEQVLEDLYEGLTTESSSGEVKPGVADSWTIDATGTEYHFKLRPDARWSNGQPVTAQDFILSWQRAVDPKFGSPNADNFRLITHATEIIAGKEPPSSLGVSAPSKNDLVVKIERPASYFPQILAHIATYPVYFRAGKIGGTRDATDWVSNGPYILSKWFPTTSVDLSANESYWDRTHVSIDKVRYVFIPNDTVQYAAYRAGELDLTDIVPANALPQIRQQYAKELQITPYLGTVYYGVNLSNNVLQNAPLRKALAMAIDRKRLVQLLGFGQTPAYGFIAPGTANYTLQEWNWKAWSDSHRIEQAKELYLQAGYSSKKPLRLRVLFNTNEVIERTAVAIAAMWKDVLGIDVDLTSEEYKVFLESRHNAVRWDLARLAWIADYNDASNFLEVLRGNSVNNDMGYKNPRFDSDLDQAENSIDESTRREGFQAAEREMLDDYPIIPLYHFVSKRMAKPYLHGATASPFNRIPTRILTLDRH